MNRHSYIARLRELVASIDARWEGESERKRSNAISPRMEEAIRRAREMLASGEIETDNEWYERERAAFIAWWESEGQKKFGADPTLAAGAGWLARADAARSATLNGKTEERWK